MSTPLAKLYQPTKIGAIEVANRLIMAPLTRCRANANGEHVPTDLMAEYYTQRATAGLIIAECSAVVPNASAFYTDPGIYNSEQAAAWKKVTDSVHAAGGKIILQIWHGGRACPAEYNRGLQPVAPSAIAITHRYKSALDGELKPNDVPRALTDDEAREIIAAYGEAARRAVEEAGFDGVELHGANGYLINQFLTPNANKRGAESHYSGESIETRARFMLEAVEAAVAAVGKERVGIRLSPHVIYNNANYANPEADAAYLASELNKREIAFIHVERRDMFTPTRDKTVDVTNVFKANFNHAGGSIIANIDFERAEAEQHVEDGKSDAIALGVPFLANPDIVRRFKEKRDDERNVPNMDTFYVAGPKGYTDYPFLA